MEEIPHGDSRTIGGPAAMCSANRVTGRRAGNLNEWHGLYRQMIGKDMCPESRSFGQLIRDRAGVTICCADIRLESRQ
jgi:hypothetical protein